MFKNRFRLNVHYVVSKQCAVSFLLISLATLCHSSILGAQARARDPSLLLAEMRNSPLPAATPHLEDTCTLANHTSSFFRLLLLGIWWLLVIWFSTESRNGPEGVTVAGSGSAWKVLPPGPLYLINLVTRTVSSEVSSSFLSCMPTMIPRVTVNKRKTHY